MQNGAPKGIVDAERHRHNSRHWPFQLIIYARMLGLCEADSMRDPGTTLASAATLAQKAATNTYPKH